MKFKINELLHETYNFQDAKMEQTFRKKILILRHEKQKTKQKTK